MNLRPCRTVLDTKSLNSVESWKSCCEFGKEKERVGEFLSKAHLSWKHWLYLPVIDLTKLIYFLTRDNPGNALVFKQKFNREKLQYWNFSMGAKIVGITQSFISLHWKHQDNSNSWLLPLHGAMNHSGTPLWLMLRSPFFTNVPIVSLNPAKAKSKIPI